MASAQCVTTGAIYAYSYNSYYFRYSLFWPPCLSFFFCISLFDFDRYGDEDFGAEKSGFVEHRQRPNDGKLEKSFLNFQQHHPNFDGGKAAKSMCSRLNAYKDVK